MEEVVNAIWDLEEGKGVNDGVGSDTIAAYKQAGDEREIGQFDQGGVALEHDEPSRANQDGFKFQQGESLARLGRDRGIHLCVEAQRVLVVVVTCYVDEDQNHQDQSDGCKQRHLRSVNRHDRSRIECFLTFSKFGGTTPEERCLH